MCENVSVMRDDPTRYLPVRGVDDPERAEILADDVLRSFDVENEASAMPNPAVKLHSWHAGSDSFLIRITGICLSQPPPAHVSPLAKPAPRHSFARIMRLMIDDTTQWGTKLQPHLIPLVLTSSLSPSTA